MLRWLREQGVDVIMHLNGGYASYGHVTVDRKNVGSWHVSWPSPTHHTTTSPSIDEQRRALRAAAADRAHNTLAIGVRVLKYWRHPQAAHIEAELLHALAVLENDGADNAAIKAALVTLEGAIGLGAASMADVMGGSCSIGVVDDEFAPEAESDAHVRYRQRVAAALEARQTHAPGFDGVGGGRSR